MIKINTHLWVPCRNDQLAFHDLWCLAALASPYHIIHSGDWPSFPECDSGNELYWFWESNHWWCPHWTMLLRTVIVDHPATFFKVICNASRPNLLSILNWEKSLVSLARRSACVKAPSDFGLLDKVAAKGFSPLLNIIQWTTYSNNPQLPFQKRKPRPWRKRSRPNRHNIDFFEWWICFFFAIMVASKLITLDQEDL